MHTLVVGHAGSCNNAASLPNNAAVAGPQCAQRTCHECWSVGLCVCFRTVLLRSSSCRMLVVAATHSQVKEQDGRHGPAPKPVPEPWHVQTARNTATPCLRCTERPRTLHTTTIHSLAKEDTTGKNTRSSAAAVWHLSLCSAAVAALPANTTMADIFNEEDDDLLVPAQQVWSAWEAHTAEGWGSSLCPACCLVRWLGVVAELCIATAITGAGAPAGGLDGGAGGPSHAGWGWVGGGAV